MEVEGPPAVFEEVFCILQFNANMSSTLCDLCVLPFCVSRVGVRTACETAPLICGSTIYAGIEI